MYSDLVSTYVRYQSTVILTASQLKLPSESEAVVLGLQKEVGEVNQ